MFKLKLDRQATYTLERSHFFPKLAWGLARSPSGVIIRTAEAELLSHITMEVPILDLGCGNGYFASLIKPDGMDVGCDISKIDLERAAKRKQYRLLVYCDTTKELPFPARSFTTVVSNSSLEHMNGIDVVLKEVSRVLKPRGKLVFTLGSNYTYEWWPLSEKAKQQYLRFQPVYNYFSLKKWREPLLAAGLILVAHQYYLNKEAIRKAIWFDYHFGRVYLTKDWTLTRPLIRAFLRLPRKVLAKICIFMFRKLSISGNDAGGGILIIAEKGRFENEPQE